MRILFAVVFTLGFSMVSCAQPNYAEQTSNAVTEPAAIETEILKLVNLHRQTKGLAPLKMNNLVIEESRKHSANMAAKRVAFSHNGFNDRIKVIAGKIGGRLSSAAENVAMGQQSAREAVDGWLKSPGHKVNIEGNFTETGIGVIADKKGVLYYTQIFIR